MKSVRSFEARFCCCDILNLLAYSTVLAACQLSGKGKYSGTEGLKSQQRQLCGWKTSTELAALVLQHLELGRGRSCESGCFSLLPKSCSSYGTWPCTALFWYRPRRLAMLRLSRQLSAAADKSTLLTDFDTTFLVLWLPRSHHLSNRGESTVVTVVSRSKDDM